MFLYFFFSSYFSVVAVAINVFSLSLAHRAEHHIYPKRSSTCDIKHNHLFETTIIWVWLKGNTCVQCSLLWPDCLLLTWYVRLFCLWLFNIGTFHSHFVLHCNTSHRIAQHCVMHWTSYRIVWLMIRFSFMPCDRYYEYDEIIMSACEWLYIQSPRCTWAFKGISKCGWLQWRKSMPECTISLDQLFFGIDVPSLSHTQTAFDTDAKMSIG